MKMSEACFNRDAAIVRGAMAGKGEMYAPQLAGVLGIDPANLRRVLVEMDERGLLTSRVEGSGPKKRRWYKLAEAAA